MTQLSLFDSPESDKTVQNIGDGEYIYIPALYARQRSNELLESLLHEIAWKQERMNMYGKDLPFPRLTAWYGDNDKPYSFSGITLKPSPWTSLLLDIKNRIESLSGTSFNSVLLNRYRDGNDSISWHTDAEKELGKNPVIASVNFGAERVFQLRHIHSKKRIDVLLEHGSLLIMQGSLQHFWQHQIPKTKKKIGERVNLTFRKII